MKVVLPFKKKKKKGKSASSSQCSHVPRRPFHVYLKPNERRTQKKIKGKGKKSKKKTKEKPPKKGISYNNFVGHNYTTGGGENGSSMVDLPYIRCAFRNGAF